MNSVEDIRRDAATQDARISKVEFIPVTAPIKAAILTCYGSLASFARTILRVTTTDGVVGYSELSGRYSPKSLSRFKTIVEGASPFDVTHLIQRIKNWNYFPFERPEPVMAAFEIACLDIQGRMIGRPLHDLIGGKVRDRVPVSSYIFFRHSNDEGEGGIETAEDVVAFAEEQVARHGFTSLKLKGGYHAPERDLEALRALRGRFGPGMGLRLDPQGCWTVSTTARVGRELAALGLEYLEDPCWGTAMMARARDLTGLPFATNMCVTQFEEVAPALSMGAVDVILSDLWYWGGIRACMSVDALCFTHGLDLGMHSGAELGIGWEAMLHTAAALPHLHLSIDNMNLHLVDDLLVGGLIKPQDGHATPPGGPGLGIEVGEDKLAEFAENASTGRLGDRFLNPDLADSARPGWHPRIPAW